MTVCCQIIIWLIDFGNLYIVHKNRMQKKKKKKKRNRIDISMDSKQKLELDPLL